MILNLINLLQLQQPAQPVLIKFSQHEYTLVRNIYFSRFDYHKLIQCFLRMQDVLQVLHYNCP